MPASSKIYGVKRNDRAGEYLFRFDSCKDSAALVAHLEAFIEIFKVNWRVTFTTAQHFHRLNGMDSPYWSTNEGEVILTFSYRVQDLPAHDQKHVWDKFHQLVDNVAHRYGRWLGISGVPPDWDRPNTISFRLEMDSVLASDNLVRELDPQLGGAEYFIRGSDGNEVSSLIAPLAHDPV